MEMASGVSAHWPSTMIVDVLAFHTPTQRVCRLADMAFLTAHRPEGDQALRPHVLRFRDSELMLAPSSFGIRDTSRAIGLRTGGEPAHPFVSVSIDEPSTGGQHWRLSVGLVLRPESDVTPDGFDDFDAPHDRRFEDYMGMMVLEHALGWRDGDRCRDQW